MIKAAITGNTACGKSVCEKILQEAGFKVIDCDKINADLILYSEDVKNEIAAAFGTGVLTEKGAVSKQKLASFAFNSPDSSRNRRVLENIMHPKIWRKIEEFFDENKNEQIVFVSAALIFEAGWNNKFDKIMFISADKNTRLKRLMQRCGINKETALKRISAQKDEEDKIKKSDIVIYNNADLESFKKNIHQAVISLSAELI